MYPFGDTRTAAASLLVQAHLGGEGPASGTSVAGAGLRTTVPPGQAHPRRRRMQGTPSDISQATFRRIPPEQDAGSSGRPSRGSQPEGKSHRPAPLRGAHLLSYCTTGIELNDEQSHTALRLFEARTISPTPGTCRLREAPAAACIIPLKPAPADFISDSRSRTRVGADTTDGRGW